MVLSIAVLCALHLALPDGAQPPPRPCTAVAPREPTSEAAPAKMTDDGAPGSPTPSTAQAEPVPAPPVPAPSAPPPPPVHRPLALPSPAPPEHPRAAALPVQEETRYDVRYGWLGSVGEVVLSAGTIDRAADGMRIVRLWGEGQGAVLGLGALRRQLESELELTSLGPRRWTAARPNAKGKEGGGPVDSATRGSGNVWTLERAIPGQPAARQTVTFQAPTADPLGLLWRLRTAPPAAGHSERYQLLDGQQLWRVDITAARGGEILAEGGTALRFEGTLAPLTFDGSPDPGRPTRTFQLWLSDGPGHLPLRLEVPVGLSDVVITLAGTRKLAAATSTPQPSRPAPGAQEVPVVPGARSL